MGCLHEGEYGGIPRDADALSGALADVANSDDDDNENADDEDGESCNVDGGNGVMSSLSCLNNKLSLLTRLNDVELNVFDVDDILVESNDADKGGKDEKEDNDDSRRQRQQAFVALDDGAKWDVVDGLDERRVKSGPCHPRRCLLTGSIKILFLLNSRALT